MFADPLCTIPIPMQGGEGYKYDDTVELGDDDIVIEDPDWMGQTEKREVREEAKLQRQERRARRRLQQEAEKQGVTVEELTGEISKEDAEKERQAKRKRRLNKDGHWEYVDEDEDDPKNPNKQSNIHDDPKEPRTARGKKVSDYPAKVEMLDEGKITRILRRSAIGIPTVRISIRCFLTPLLERERRVRNHAVKHHQFATRDVLRITQSIALANVRIEHTMQEHVHLADRPSVQVHFLTIQREVLRVVPVFDEVVAGLDQHATRPRCRVVYAHSCFWFKQRHQQPNNFARRVKFAALLTSRVCELLDQIFICRPKKIRGFKIHIPQAVL